MREVILDLAYGLIAAAALTGLLRYKQLPPAMRLVALLTCFTVVLELTSFLLVKISPTSPNLFLFPVGLLGEVLLLTLAYRQALASPPLGRWLLGALGLYCAFLFTEVWLKLGTVQFYVAAQVVSDVATLGLAALYFWKLLSDLQVEQPSQDPFFWLSVGLIVYSLGDSLIALSSDYVLAHYSRQAQVLVLVIIRNLFNVLLYTTFLVTLWLRPPRVSS